MLGGDDATDSVAVASADGGWQWQATLKRRGGGAMYVLIMLLAEGSSGASGIPWTCLFSLIILSNHSVLETSTTITAAVVARNCFCAAAAATGLAATDNLDNGLMLN